MQAQRRLEALWNRCADDSGGAVAQRLTLVCAQEACRLSTPQQRTAAQRNGVAGVSVCALEPRRAADGAAMAQRLGSADVGGHHQSNTRLFGKKKTLKIHGAAGHAERGPRARLGGSASGRRLDHPGAAARLVGARCIVQNENVDW